MFLLFNIIKYLISLISYKPQQMRNMSHNYDSAVYQGKPTYTDGFGHTYHVKTGKMVWDTMRTVGDEEHRVLLDSHTCLLVEDLTENHIKSLFEEEHDKISNCMYNSLKNRFNSRKNAIENNESSYSFEEEIYYKANNKEHTNIKEGSHNLQMKTVKYERIYNTYNRSYIMNSDYKENDISKMNYIYNKEISINNYNDDIFINTKNALNNYYKYKHQLNRERESVRTIYSEYDISYEEFIELLSYSGVKTLYIKNDESKQIYSDFIYDKKDIIMSLKNLVTKNNNK